VQDVVPVLQTNRNGVDEIILIHIMSVEHSNRFRRLLSVLPSNTKRKNMN